MIDMKLAAMNTPQTAAFAETRRPGCGAAPVPVGCAELTSRRTGASRPAPRSA
ncbi:hypothetical protein [Streptomyces plumbiresistens]|uniref:hypothetical protein n=1 Tax=Streptomyces plumbiresistens TaxID=511811 RepID=UPI0031E65562